MQRNWSPYAVGGATRPDSFTSMTPAMQEGLWSLLQASDQELGGGLQVYSGYRSPELQAQLYDNALKKYGSPEKARKWVAPPGRSKHNSGQAADLKYNGVRIDKLPKDHPARVWLESNVAKFGLAQPMSWEPWQIEVAGARSAAPTAPAAQPTAPDAQQTADLTTLAGWLGGGEPQQAPMAGLGRALMQSEAPAAPQLMPMPQAQSYQPQRRDTLSPYLKLFQSLRG